MSPRTFSMKASRSACARGAESLTGLVAEFGQDVVEAYMAHVQDNAEEAVRRVLARLSDGAFAYELDDSKAAGPDLAILKGHWTQLKPILAKNYDILTAVQLGCIGRRGEGPNATRLPAAIL